MTALHKRIMARDFPGALVACLAICQHTRQAVQTTQTLIPASPGQDLVVKAILTAALELATLADKVYQPKAFVPVRWVTTCLREYGVWPEELYDITPSESGVSAPDWAVDGYLSVHGDAYTIALLERSAVGLDLFPHVRWYPDE